MIHDSTYMRQVLQSRSMKPRSRIMTFSADPMSDPLRGSMVPVAITAILSLMSTGSILFYLIWTYPRARKMRRKFSPQYQNVILIFNLLSGDFIQSFGFTLDSAWLLQRKVYLGTICNMQGSLIQIGDMVGTLCVMSIALHTFTYVVLRRSVSKPLFYGWITGIWLISLGLGVALPLASQHSRKGHAFYWSLAGSWCWIRPDYSFERLFSHYIIIFFVQVMCIIVYLAIYTKLVLFSRKRGEELGSSNPRVERAARLMLIYPVAYIFCTLPLASMRVHTMLGGNVGLAMSSLFGAIFTSSGVINSVLYGMTRALRRDRRPDTLHDGRRHPHQKLSDFDPLQFMQDQYKVVATLVFLFGLCAFLLTFYSVKSENVLAEKPHKKRRTSLVSSPPPEPGTCFTLDHSRTFLSPIHVQSETVMRSETVSPLCFEMNEIPDTQDRLATVAQLQGENVLQANNSLKHKQHIAHFVD